eukprot:CAMPEP_0184488476 /NCGR_PEP_ID=MMETSP0113_2-20130426/12165_1 /TAXON_ID=91329 /ORGANISM="Norrisiella sphaerica, Strain BC52" /LENGTH=195 /DNA_ID=CAMNT_0026871293 /DNA_START=16 /DNA_END=603 /DNA_ORIENTATION=+
MITLINLLASMGWRECTVAVMTIFICALFYDLCLARHSPEHAQLLATQRQIERKIASVKQRIREEARKELDDEGDDIGKEKSVKKRDPDFPTLEAERVRELLRICNEEERQNSGKIPEARSMDGRKRIRELLKKHENDVMKVLKDMVTNHMEDLRAVVSSYTDEEATAKVNILEGELKTLVDRVTSRFKMADKAK